jgi:hypothetical protein
MINTHYIVTINTLLVAMYCLNVSASIGYSELKEPGLEFKQYVLTLPYIERIEYEQSHNGKYGPGFVRADGAYQPNGYYSRYLTNSPITSNMIVRGLDLDVEWEYAPDWKIVCYGPRKYATNYLTAMNNWALFDLLKVIELGFPEITKNTFVWTTQNDFEFKNRWGTFVGSINSFDGNRPTLIEFHAKDNKNEAHWPKSTIKYIYNTTNSFPPDVFIECLESPKDHSMITTNIIHNFNIGLAVDATNGYNMTNFIPDNAEIDKVNLISNKIRYTVNQDGSIVKYKYVDSTEAFARPARYSIILFVLVCLTLIGVSFKIRRGKKE